MGELGLISGTGMGISLFANLTLLPALLSLGTPEASPAGRAAPRWITQFLIPLASRHYRVVLAGAALLAVAAGYALRWVDFDVSVARIRAPQAESVQVFEELLAESKNSPWTIDLIEPDLQSAQRTAAELTELPEVESAITLADYIPENQEEKLEILADLAYFVPAPATYTDDQPAPTPREQVEAVRGLRSLLDASWLVDANPERAASVERARHQLDRLLARLDDVAAKEDALGDFQKSLLGALPDQLRMLWNALDPGTVDLSQLPPDLVRRMVAPDGRARVEVIPSGDLNDDVALADFVDAVRKLRPQATGSAVSILEWARATIRSFQEAMVLATLAIGLVVFALWRSFRDLALVMTPLLLAALFTGATAAATGLSFNFANLVVLPLLLGIGVDSGIHLVHRHRVAEQQHLHLATAPELLGTSTAQAVLFSALTTMASFFSLALSSHGGLSSLGKLLLIGVSYMLACNLVVLPALIRAVRRDTWEDRS